VQANKGSKAAAVALARKALCTLYHLSANREAHLEDGVQNKVFRMKYLE
jgi:hypothetical protein